MKRNDVIVVVVAVEQSHVIYYSLLSKFLLEQKPLGEKKIDLPHVIHQIYVGATTKEAIPATI